jgi:hypothetical protein
MIKRYFANGWIAALETLRNDIEVAVKNGDIYRAEDVYDMIDGYIDVASSRLTPLQADRVSSVRSDEKGTNHAAA